MHREAPEPFISARSLARVVSKPTPLAATSSAKIGLFVGSEGLTSAGRAAEAGFSAARLRPPSSPSSADPS